MFGDANRVVQKWNDQRVLVTWANTNTNTFAKYDGIATKFIVPPDMKLYLRAYTDDSYLLRLHNFNTNSTVIYRLIIECCNNPRWMEGYIINTRR